MKKIRQERLAYPNTSEDWRYENAGMAEALTSQLCGDPRYPTELPKELESRLPSWWLRSLEDGEKKKTPIWDEMRKR